MAIWTESQIKNLNNYQKCGCFHSYTCGGTKDGKDCRADLVATENGWVCPENCGYTQMWAHNSHTTTDFSEGQFKPFFNG